MKKFFSRIGGLDTNVEKGPDRHFKTTNDTHYSVYITIPFDGANKPAFQLLFEPDLSKQQIYVQ